MLVSSSDFNVQGHIPSTGGDALMGAKHDKVKKKGQRADWEEKIAAVPSYWLQ
jgi:hypothetical protein